MRHVCKAVLLAAAALVTTTGTLARETAPIAPRPEGSDEASRLARALVARMTLEEKLPQLLNVAPAIPRLQIPAYNWWTESLHGALGPLATTNFPEPIGLAATSTATWCVTSPQR